MLRTQILLYVFLYGFSLLVESVNAWRLKSIRNFVGKYTLCFWLSAFLIVMSTICQRAISEPEGSVFLMVVSLTLGMLGTFFLTVYLLFRGMLVLFKISGEGEQHPTCLTIKRLIQRPLLAYCLIVGLTLLCYVGPIYSIWAYWQMVP